MAQTPSATLPLSRIGDDRCFGDLLSQERVRRQVEGGASDPGLLAAADVKPFNQRGGHEPFNLDLSDARFTSPGYIEYPATGQALVYSIQGSTPGGVLDFDFDGGGQELFCIPGAKLIGPFSRVIIKRNPASITSGSVYLRIINQPDVDYTELARLTPGGVLGNPSGAGVGPAGATTQAYNVTTNIPSLATDGLSLQGVSGVRAQVISAAGSTIAGGQLIWWQYDTVTGLWGETDMVDDWAAIPRTARRIWFPLDKQVWVPEGRIYPELRSATNSAGAGAFTVRLYTWGV